MCLSLHRGGVGTNGVPTFYMKEDGLGEEGSFRVSKWRAVGVWTQLYCSASWLREEEGVKADILAGLCGPGQATSVVLDMSFGPSTFLSCRL